MKFRIVYFTPDPFRGDRFAIGAVVGDGASAKFHRAGHVPGPECLGGRDSWITLQMALDTLTGIDRLDVERGTASQLVSLSDAREAPSNVDAAEWVDSTFLHRTRDTRDERSGTAHQEPRSQYGVRFFEQWKVMRYVKNRFDLGDFMNLPAGMPPVAHKPTHWVKGRDTVLLMEPVVGTRPSLAADLKLISSSMLAQMKLFELAKVKAKPEMIAYVFSNGYRGALAETREALNKVGLVVDVESKKERDVFIKHIQDVGDTEPNLFDF